MAKLSVIFANKDRGDLLEGTLDAWSRQRVLKDIELIVVDDGSFRLPTRVCDEYNAKLVKLKGSEFRKNPATAWNAGLKVAKGEILACTHAEIIPSLDAGRYLYGVCTGDAEMLEGIRVWAPAPTTSGWRERFIEEEDRGRLDLHAIRANVVTLRMREGQGYPHGGDPETIQNFPDFWTYETEFGGHSNHAITHQHRGFFWNNLFAMKREVWRWMNYMRPSQDWGADDSDFQLRNQLLKIAYVFTDDLYAYHQWHGPDFRGGCDDFGTFETLEEARLLGQRGSEDHKMDLRTDDFWKWYPEYDTIEDGEENGETVTDHLV